MLLINYKIIAVIHFLYFSYSQWKFAKSYPNLTNYVKYESWKYCDRCHIVVPNKMLPTYGNQKLTYLTNCICTKGRYFVPMVCIISLISFALCTGNVCQILLFPIIWLKLSRNSDLTRNNSQNSKQKNSLVHNSN